MLPSSIHDFANPQIDEDHRRDTTRGKDGAGGESQIPQSRVGRHRLGIRLAPYAIRDVLRRARASSPAVTATVRSTGMALPAWSTGSWIPISLPTSSAAKQTDRTQRQPMKVAITNLGQIVPAIGASHSRLVTQLSSTASALHPSAACRRRREQRRCCDRRRRHDGDPRPDRLACPCHVRRLHAAPTHRRLSRKLSARRHHDRHLRVRGACSGTTTRCRRCQGAGGGRTTLFAGLPARRHARHRRLGHSRARPDRADFKELKRRV